MKFLVFILTVGAALAQETPVNPCKGAAAAAFKEKVVISITTADGTTETSTIEGVCAAAGLDTFAQWVADQNRCAGTEPCQPKYSSLAHALKVGVASTVAQLAERFPSKATTAERKAVEDAEAALKAKQDALMKAIAAEAK